MQEVLVYTNRRMRPKVTAWGGFVAGCLIAGAAVSGRHAHKAQQEQDQLRAAFAVERQALLGQRDEARRDLRATAARYTGEPVDWLAARVVRNLGALEKRLAQFPEFKTESFWTSFNLLRAEVAIQSAEAEMLTMALRSVAGPAQCAIADASDAPSVWAEGNVSLTSRGWVGVHRAGAAP